MEGLTRIGARLAKKPDHKISKYVVNCNAPRVFCQWAVCVFIATWEICFSIRSLSRRISSKSRQNGLAIPVIAGLARIGGLAAQWLRFERP